MPSTLYNKHLGKNNFKSVLLSALFGIPLPLCSCGVIPTAMGIRREGASKGATISFLIATPQTGVDSIVATYSLMGLPFAVIRPVAALFTAVLGGLFSNALESADEHITPVAAEPSARSTSSCRGTLLHRIGQALNYAFVEMVQDIGKWLMIGLLVAGIITAVVPDAWFTVFQENSFYSILFVLLFSIPMYLCATGSIPIAVALMLKGLTPGAALVLLMAGPASNAASILVINKVLGRRSLLIYLFSIITGAILFGLAIDYLLPADWFTSVITNHHACHSEQIGWFSYICTGIMALPLLNAFGKFRCFGKTHTDCHCHCQNAHNGETTPHVQDEEPIIYKVEGMHCNHCVAHVERAISALPQVLQVKVDLESGRTAITGHPDEQEIIRAVESLGYSITKA